MPVNFGTLKVSALLDNENQTCALLDSGSTVNIISNSLFKSVPSQCVYSFKPSSECITVASNVQVQVLGVARVKLSTPYGKHKINVYVLSESSHPLILGTSFLAAKGISLNFSKHKIKVSKCKVRIKKATVIPANSESILKVKVNREVPYGLPGLCTISKELQGSDLFVAKSICHVSADHTVPVKVLNPSNNDITLRKGQVVAKFSMLDETDHVSRVNFDTARQPELGKVNSTSVGIDQAKSGTMETDRSRFSSYFDLSNTKFDTTQKGKFADFLYRNKAIFVTDENPKLGMTHLVEHKIHLKPDAVHKHQRPYRLSPDKKEVLRHQLNELVSQGIITPVDESEDLPITSPIVLVAKKGNKTSHPTGSKEASLAMFRFCCDFRHLNLQTQDFNYAIPDLQELTESFANRTPNYISCIDLSSSFFQMPISSESTKYTAFNTCFGTYKFSRLPQGLKTAPNSFQLLMDKVLRGLSFQSVLSYLDDMIVFSPTFDQHLIDLQEVFSRLQEAGLKLNPRKCSFGRESCTFLGHEVSKEGIKPPSDKVQVIKDLPAPENQRELRRLMGMLNWFRKFIPNFSSVANPLNALLKSGVAFHWGGQQQAALDALKSSLVNSPALAFPRFDIPFHLQVDTSSHGLGYMLYQIHPESEFPEGTSERERTRVVRFGSKGLSKWQRSYGPTKLELLGMVTSIMDCASYLRGSKFNVLCDHQALKPIFQKKLKGAIYERYIAILQQFDFNLQWKPGSEMVVPDALSRAIPKIATQPLCQSPDEDDPYFPYVPESQKQALLPDGQNLHDLLLHDSSNMSDNEAELQVNMVTLRSKQRLPSALTSHDTVQLESTQVTCQSEYDADSDDSAELFIPRKACKVTRPVRARCRQKNREKEKAEPVTYQSELGKCSEQQDSTTGNDSENVTPSTKNHQVTEQKSQSAGETPVLESDSDPEPDSLELQTQNLELFQKFDFSSESVKELQATDPDLHLLVAYLTNGTLPKSQKKARRILVTSGNFILVDGLLFHSRDSRGKRTKILEQYQLVLPQILIKTVVQLYHDSPMGGHGGIKDTIDRVKEHYYFPKLDRIITEYVRSCHECQVRKMTKAHTKAGIVAFPTPSAPHKVWEADLYGPLPLTPQGNTYILTLVDMFSKFVVAIPLANKDSLSVSDALFQVVCTYGVFDTLITDQGTEFTSKITQQLCSLLHVSHQFTPSFVHHCLGACERTHATLAERLTPYVQTDKKNWQDVLPAIIFSMNSTVNASLGYSPHEIVYGQRPSFPLSSHLLAPDFSSLPQDMHAYVKQQATKLELIRKEVEKNSTRSKQKMVDRMNCKTNPLNLKEGDYVYLLDETSGKAKKLKPKYTGPFVVHDIASPHMILLAHPDTKRVQKHPVHINRLKMAYVRVPEPSPFFPDKVVLNIYSGGEQDIQGAVDAKATEEIIHEDYHTAEEHISDKSTQISESEPQFVPRRSSRQQRIPDRYGVCDPVSLRKALDSDSVSSDSKGYHKIKRVLGQRKCVNGIEYLVHLVGEPSQKAFWVKPFQMDIKAKKAVESKPPPMITA